VDGKRVVAGPTEAELERARAVVAAQLRPTPVVALELPDGRGEVLAKLECMQPTGSFKVRGALAALAARAAAGTRVVAASAGNHALGVVLASRRLGVPATVVVPRTASAAKLAALRRLGADLVEHGDTYDQAERQALRLAGDGAAFVSGYNDPQVIAGQATCGWELDRQVEGELTVVVPVGGGGLLAGTALWAARRPGVRVVGVEAAASRALSTAVRAARVVEVPVGATLADGLAGNLEPGSVTPSLVTGRVHSFAAVSEAEIEAAIRFLALRCGLVVEGAGAAGMAALLAGKVPVAGQAVVLLTGRNIAPATLARIVGDEELTEAGKLRPDWDA
jgi:threonine dehydratase